MAMRRQWRWRAGVDEPFPGVGEEQYRLEMAGSWAAASERWAAVPRGQRAATRANPANLTRRELEVLLLLADGSGNAEIAERLIVSRKTVDHHVSAILRKLAVNTRGQAAAEAARLGLTVQR